MNFAYQQMGQTIVGGALTSCISACFLIMCQADVLNKFGILLLTTIVASSIISLIFMPSMLYIFGPESEQGSFKACSKHRLKTKSMSRRVLYEGGSFNSKKVSHK